MKALRFIGTLLVTLGLLVMVGGVARVANQENALHANVVRTMEENSGSQEPLLNTSQEYSLNGTISIESEGLEAVLMESVSDKDLDLGVGHYPGTAYPGQAGNFAVAVHRPLVANIDSMGPGDTIVVVNNGVEYTYEWRESFVVAPDRVDVLDSMEGKWLTLTTCHPRYSNAQRLIVRAELTQVGG